MSRRIKNLRKVFDTEVSESRLRGLTRGARQSAIEAATRRLERSVSKETQRAVEEAELRQADILRRREEKKKKGRKEAEKKQLKRDKEEAEQQNQRCSCRRPTIIGGVCTRCKKPTAGGRRR